MGLNAYLQVDTAIAASSKPLQGAIDSSHVVVYDLLSQ